ncbi:ADP-ribosylglycohydrolase family protein [Candidatus Contendibacter odensensis]|uniref:ADP-ribosyl-(Dinitrogen reductase) hydrolase n=1 Tax=Candidatus Contendobacter odensis Run_B_J11 TaxID=1400861 RepID=A0A7U7J4A4_9GAMM
MTLQSRALGCLLGLAAGDAVGTTLEFSRRDSYPPLTDMIGGGPFHLQAGQWTDDTSMALALGESLCDCGELNLQDLMDRFVAWYRQGRYSCVGTCFDIGMTTQLALQRFMETGNPEAGNRSPSTAGNGSLMRLAPIPIFYHPDLAAGVGVARRQSVATHGAAEAIDACAAYAELLILAINGKSRDEVLTHMISDLVPGVAAVIGGSWRDKSRDQISSSGYVVHSLEAALWCVAGASGFKEAVLLAANLGNDADTVAAITGQLAGALWGMEGIPADWLAKLAWREHIERLGLRLLRHERTIS